MATLEHLHHMMSEIGNQLDLGAVSQFDEEDSAENKFWSLVFDEDFVIEVSYVAADPGVYCAASLGQPPADSDTDFYKLLLQYNYLWEQTGGARMAIDSEGEVWLANSLSLATLELPQLQAILENMRDTAANWRELIRQGLQSGPNGEVAGLDDLAELGSVGALRV